MLNIVDYTQGHLVVVNSKFRAQHWLIASLKKLYDI